MATRAAGAPNPESLLSRELGVRQLAAGIFNYTVGSGIFALPAVVVAQAGPAAPLVYVVCALLIGLVVLCLAAAGSRVSATGGPYAYVEAALGPLVGFMAGVLLLVTDISGTAAVATLLAGTVARAVAGGEAPWLERGLVLAVFSGLAAVNVRGVAAGARLVEVVTVAKLLPLLGLVAVGAAYVEPAHLDWTRSEGTGSLMAAAGALIFAFAGIEAALLPSGEVRDPARTVPRAALLALGCVTLLYLAIHLVAQGVLGPALSQERVTPLAEVAARVAGTTGRSVLLAGAAVSTFGYLCGAMLAGPRSLFAFARDGFLPRRLASVHPRRLTPHVAIVTYAIVAASLALSGTFAELAILTSTSVMLLYALCAVAAALLQRRGVRGEGEPFRLPAGPLIPALACVVILAVLKETIGTREAAAVGMALGVAVALWAWRRWRPAR
jgi:amino acid transporter